jgi:ribonuclease HI
MNSSASSGKLFGGGPPTPDRYLVAYTDGGSRGNPGPAGYGVVIQDEKGRQVAGLSQYLGRQTNNFAEYQGLIAALEYAVKQGPKALKVISDSELLVRQMKGIYKVSNASLADLHGRARQLVRQLEWFQIEHVLRGHNREADRLANEAMDQGMNKSAARTVSAVSLPPEYDGVVRDGKIELTAGSLPEGTRVRIRVKT